MIALNVKVGDAVEMRHEEHGCLGTIVVAHKSGQVARLIFDLAPSMRAKLMNHREHGITWGISSTPRIPMTA